MNSGATILDISRRKARQRHRAPIVEQALEAARITKMPVSLGSHKFFTDLPVKDAIRQVHDNLTLFHAVEIFFKNFSTIYLFRLRENERDHSGSEVYQPLIFNTATSGFGSRFSRNSKYTSWSLINIEKSGPIVVEMPPGMLGIVRDLWFRVVEDIGFGVAHRERDLKYLLLPPGYKGSTPRNYSVIRLKTSCASIFMRPAVARPSSPAAKPEGLRMYPWSDLDNALQAARPVDNPPQAPEDLVPGDESFYYDLDRLVQEQPLNSVDKNRRALFASIGIVKGRPFCPGASMNSILGRAAAIGDAAVRAIHG